MALNDPEDTNTPTEPAEKPNPICTEEQPCGSVKNCISCIFATIRELQDEVNRIKRETYDDRVAHNRVHDPLFRMPPELMSLIFRFAIEFDHPDPTTDVIESYLTESGSNGYIRPILLASVSARWRKIALADPGLWSTINIAYRMENPDLGRQSWTPSLEIVGQWIARSGALPLRIVLKWDDGPESTKETLGDIIEALCGQCHRWRSLYIHVPPRAMARFHFAASEHPIDLEYLFIEHGDLVDHLVAVGRTTLRPRHACLQSTPRVPGSYQWTNLATLQISNASPYECLDVIQEATQLESLKVAFFRTGDEGTALPPTAPIVAARLREMDIGFVVNDVLEQFFMNVRAPELDSLELLRYLHIGTPVSLDFLAPMLLQSETGNKLKRLLIGGIACSSEDLLTVLWGLNKLSHFSMIYVRKEDTPPPLDDFLEKLATTAVAVGDNVEGVSFLPELSEFCYSGSRTFSWRALADVLQAHNIGAPRKRPLKSLTTLLRPVSVPEDYVDKETLFRLLDLQFSSGVKLAIEEELFRASFERHETDYPFSSVVAFCT